MVQTAQVVVVLFFKGEHSQIYVNMATFQKLNKGRFKPFCSVDRGDCAVL